MTYIRNLFVKLWQILVILYEGLSSLVRLIGLVVGALRGGEGDVKTRIGAALKATSGQRLVFAVLRAFAPNLAIKKSLVKAYDNSSTAIVTRYKDVLEVLDRDDVFEVVYEPRMRAITGNENFFLGMQNTARYARDVSNMRLAMRREDVAEIVKPFAEQQATELVEAAKGSIDVPQDLTLVVPTRMVGRYFGTPGPSEQDMIDWTTIMFWYLFIDLGAEEAVIAKAEDAAQKCRGYLDEAIRERKAQPTQDDDVLNRCLAMQGADLPRMDDLGIRNNLIGLIIGAIPTISKSANHALDQLLDRPEALAAAQAAAQADDDELLARYVFEAFRFNPANPVIYRRAAADTVIARSTLRARKIPKGAMVFAANLSAMFDPMQLPSPNEFRVDRPWADYILWGYGMHTCFGAYINRAVIPIILKPLLKQRNLRRAAGDAGRMDNQGTPFPVHQRLEFDVGA